MKSPILSIFFVLSLLAGYAQVNITEFPKDKQLYPRDRATNNGLIEITGTVEQGAGFTTLRVKMYRDNEFRFAENRELAFENGRAKFHFELPINAELYNYSVRLYSVKGNHETLIKRANDIVAGDAFIINGQSNSVANIYKGSSKSFKNPFIRSFGTTMHDSTAEHNLNWYIAEGDSVAYPGAIGQWGLKTACAIVQSEGIPVAVIAGGVGGTHMLQHMRNDKNPEDLQTIYGRLLYRTKNAGLKDDIRAIWWHQGESDGYYRRTVAEYKQLWNALKVQWLQDYPGVTDFFTFQIRQGCGDWQNYALNIMEAQRQLAMDSTNVHIISTNGVDQNIDYCHFPFKKGYECFADRLIPQMNALIYNKAATADMHSPNISSARLISPNTLEITFGNMLDSLQFQAGVQYDFKFEDSDITFVNGYSSFNKIYLTLSESTKSKLHLSYTGHPGQGSPYIKTQNGNGALSFYNFPVEVSWAR